MDNTTVNLHVSKDDKDRWNDHIGNFGINHHKLGNGVTAGFSEDNFTKIEKEKLAGVEEGATRYIHPPTHPASMITGLHIVATTGDYNSLINKPTKMTADGGNSDTVGGIRIYINNDPPPDPKNGKEIWIKEDERVTYIYIENNWKALGSVFLP